MSNALVNEDYDAIVRVVGKLATDVWDETPLPEHVRAACAGESQTERVMLALSNVFGREFSDLSFATDEWLDMVGKAWGTVHVRMIRIIATGFITIAKESAQ